MTPIHQQLIDTILEHMHHRVQELIHNCQPAGKTHLAEPTREQLRQTVLGQHLAAIAHYVEGYPYPFEGDVRASAGFVARCLYGGRSALSARGLSASQMAADRTGKPGPCCDAALL